MILSLICFGKIKLYCAFFSACKGRRAAAVHWKRTQEGGITVDGVWDFGVERVSNAAMDYFGEDLGDESEALPPVPNHLWAENRFVPVPDHILDGAPLPGNHMINEDALAKLNSSRMRNGTLWMCSHPDSTPLFAAGQRPAIRFPAADLAQRLINLPANNPPLQDFVLDLGDVLLGVMAEGGARIG